MSANAVTVTVMFTFYVGIPLLAFVIWRIECWRCTRAGLPAPRAW